MSLVVADLAEASEVARQRARLADTPLVASLSRWLAVWPPLDLPAWFHNGNLLYVTGSEKKSPTSNIYLHNLLTQSFHIIPMQLVDYLTGDFLQEQYHGQRELAGMISTLDKMMKGQGALAEFLYDKKLLA